MVTWLFAQFLHNLKITKTIFVTKSHSNLSKVLESENGIFSYSRLSVGLRPPKPMENYVVVANRFAEIKIADSLRTKVISGSLFIDVREGLPVS